MAASDFYRPFATALGVPPGTSDEDLVGAIMRKVSGIRSEAELIQEKFDLAIESLVRSLRLPLSEALSVSDAAVADTCRKILERLAGLKMEVESAWDDAERTISEAASALPEDQEKEARDFVDYMSGNF
jgi:hypothetical protein